MERTISIGEGGRNMSVSRWEQQTEPGLYKTEKERESEIWDRTRIL